MKIISFSILFFIIATVASSCKKDKEEEVTCTLEYRYVTITVKGAELDDFFTIRNTTGDTIRNNEGAFFSDSTYVVLGDNYQSVIKNRVENFTFKGFINDSLVVNELLVIKADQCHIDYVSGKTEVKL